MSDPKELRRLRAELRRVTGVGAALRREGVVRCVVPQPKKPKWRIAGALTRRALMRDHDGWARRTAARVLRERGRSARFVVKKIDPLTTALAQEWSENFKASNPGCITLPLIGADAK